jgi:hypothetical protein
VNPPAIPNRSYGLRFDYNPLVTPNSAAKTTLQESGRGSCPMRVSRWIHRFRDMRIR